MSDLVFKDRVDKYHKCPKCKSIIIFIHGGGIDYDREYCINSECDYEVEYETSSNVNGD